MVADTGYSFGVKLRQPTYETNPYRLKAYVDVVTDNVNNTQHGVYAFVGYVQSGNAVILNPVYFPVVGSGFIDEIIQIAPNEDPGVVDKALGFGIYIAASGSGGFLATMSVQRLAVAPPQRS